MEEMKFFLWIDYLLHAINCLSLFANCLNLDVTFFSESLDKYNSEHEQAVGILEQRPIGMILVDCKKLKEVLIPSPLKCLEVSKLACTYILTLFIPKGLFKINM